jgi:hypothetical protein
MTTAGSLDAPIEIFGGLVTDMSPSELPHGVSPDCQDVVFSNSGVETRPGLQALFGPLAGNPTINYLKTYETLNATLRAMALDANGVLYKENTPGTLSSIATGLAANSYGNSTTIFGREYLAISDGRTGDDLPRQYDDTNFDRVSQTGPGAGPTVVDENVIVSVAASPTGATQPAAVAVVASPSGATENGFLVTITTSAAHGLSVGQSVTITGVGVAGYNGTFPVVAAPSSTQFTYIAGASGLAASGGGTAASATVTVQTTTAHGLVVGQLVTTTGIAVAAYNGTFPITTVPDATHFTFTAPTGGLAASGGGTAAAAGSVDARHHTRVVSLERRRQSRLPGTGPGPPRPLFVVPASLANVQFSAANGQTLRCCKTAGERKENMPLTLTSATIDGTPGDPITLTASFTCDAQDQQATASITALTTAVTARKSSATITVTNPDPATMAITVTI